MNKLIKYIFTSMVILFLFSCNSEVSQTYPDDYVIRKQIKNGEPVFTQPTEINMCECELYIVPKAEQIVEFTRKENRLLSLAAYDAEFRANPSYSYKVIENKVEELVAQNQTLDKHEFLKNLEFSLIEPTVKRVLQQESSKYSIETLLSPDGYQKFEESVQTLLLKSFEEKGLELITFNINAIFNLRLQSWLTRTNDVTTSFSR